jgi:photosystem II stability/assembly factor-like uncharacterized protein
MVARTPERKSWVNALIIALSVVLVGGAESAGAQPSRPSSTAKKAPAASGKELPKFKAIWEPINYPADVTLTDVFFVDSQSGWIAGSGKGGFILHTKDGGDHWTIQIGDPQSSDPPIGSLRFLDKQHGWAIQGKKLLRTSDGESWEQIGDLPNHWDVVDYLFLSPDEGVLLDGNNNVARILRTKDAGKHWTEVLPTTACHATIQVKGLSRDAQCVLKAIHFPTTSIGYAVGGTGADFDTLFVVSTQDGGNNWRIAKVVDVGEVWIGGAWGANHGLFFTDQVTGFLSLGKASGPAKLVATQDGGQTWRGLVASPGLRFCFPDPQVGWSFEYKRLNYTTDGGKRWTSREFSFPAALRGFSLPVRSRGYVVGDHGMIYRYRIVPGEYTAKGIIDAPVMPEAHP